jgi:hypothetical protein
MPDTSPFKASVCTQVEAGNSSPFKGEVGRGMGEERYEQIQSIENGE